MKSGTSIDDIINAMPASVQPYLELAPYALAATALYGIGIHIASRERKK